jgi:hypothetical protein
MQGRYRCRLIRSGLERSALPLTAFARLRAIVGAHDGDEQRKVTEQIAAGYTDKESALHLGLTIATLRMMNAEVRCKAIEHPVCSSTMFSIQHPQRSPIAGPLCHKIVTPNMITMLWAHSDARTVIQPQPPPFRLPLRHFQPFLTPNPGYPLVIYPPSIVAQQRRDPSIPIPSIVARQCDYSLP